MSRYIDVDKFLEENEGAENSGWTLRELVDNFPTADVRENVHGEWINLNNGNMRCPNCKIVYRMSMYPRNFCPNCGAEMRGDNNDRD